MLFDSSQTCNTISQLILRHNSYSISYVYLTVCFACVPLIAGIITLTKERISNNNYFNSLKFPL